MEIERRSWARIERILDEALELPRAEQETLLERACAGDPDLRRQVEALLEADRRAEGFLEGSTPVVTGLFDSPSPVAGDETTRAPAEEAIPARLGKYEIEGLLAGGGMGQVYRAYHPSLERHVAVKVIRTEAARDQGTVERFRREAKVVAALRHPGIVQVHDFDVDGGTLYMVMEYVEGESLKERLSSLHARGRRLPLEEALALFRAITEAVAYAHQRGVVHRDLKPGNILLLKEGRPVLADFGLSSLLAGERDALTGIQGTPLYMAPEQCLGTSPTPRSDVYSLGVMLYELTTGVLPFGGDTPVNVILKHLQEPPAPPSAINPEVAGPLEAIVQKALAKDLEQRYPSARELLEAIEALEPPAERSARREVDLPAPAEGRCPYRGLQPFEEEHAEFYFGREVLVEQLTERLTRIAGRLGQPTDDRLLAVLGPSGSGKSSLVRAGLIPALRRGARAGSVDWEVVVFKPGRQPLEELAAPLAIALHGGAGEGRRLREELARDGRALHAAVERTWPKGRQRRLLLVVDQFEEAFTLCGDEKERRRFFENLLYAASGRGPVVVLLTLRADLYHRCAAHRELASRIAAHQVLVGPMNEGELRRAIERPAERAGLRFEAGLVDRILVDVARQPGALPLLEHALLELWERREGRWITRKAYQESGGVTGAIAQRAETSYAGFSADEKAVVRRVFLRLTVLGSEGTPTRCRVRPGELISRAEEAPLVEGVLKKLADARLLTTGEDRIEVAHEALIQEWPTLRRWLEEDREGLRTRQHLTQAAREWVAMGREPSELYGGARLATAGEWALAHVDEMSPLEREFLEASRELAERREMERERQRERELAQAKALAEAERRRAEIQAKASRRRSLFVGALGVLLLGALGLYSLAVDRGRVLDARRLSFAAASQLETSPERALLLASEAVLREPDFQSEQALREALDALSWKPTILAGHRGPLRSVQFSPDGNRLLTASEDGTARLWDLLARVLVSFAGHQGPVMGAVFSPDGGRILTASRDGTARLWSVDGRALATFRGHRSPLVRAVFNSDGDRVLTAAEDGTARLWDLEGRALAAIAGHQARLTSAVFSPDGKRVLTASHDGTAKLWDLAGRHLVTFSVENREEVTGAVFSPDGRRVLTSSRDHTARLWDTRGRLRRTFEHTESVIKALFTSGGDTILTAASRESTARLWSEERGLLITFHGHRRRVVEMVEAGDGRLLTASEDGSARLWDPAGEPLAVFMGHGGSLTGAAVSPDGRWVATASQDGTARLWREADEPLPALRGHRDEVRNAHYSRDGRLILTASRDRTARLWDLAGRPLVVWEGHEGQVSDAVFSPDERMILTASQDGTARLWDRRGRALALFRHRGQVGTAVFSPDGRRVLTASDDGTAALWAIDGRRLAVFEHDDEVDSAVFSPDGALVLTASEDRTARLWDTSGRRLATFTGHTDQLQNAVFSPDGQRVLTASQDGSARLWDLRGGLQARLEGHAKTVEKAVFSPDGRAVLTASFDGTARLWSWTGELLATLKGHSSPVMDVCFSPDGSRIATSSQDATSRVWDRRGRPVAVLRGHEGWAERAAFSPDGRRILTASRDHTARQFMLERDDLLAEAACRVGQGLSADDIELFGVGRPGFVIERRRCPPVFSWQR